MIRRRRLQYAAAGLAYAVAVLHLFHPSHGFPRLVTVLQIDPALLRLDPRPAAFVLLALALVGGVKLVLLGAPRRPTYALGVVLVAASFVGYFAWHLSGHGGFLPGREPLYHGLQPHEAVVAHLRGDPWAGTTKVAEGLLLAVLAVLLVRDS